MNSIWFSLLWKEWREHRLIIAVLVTVAIAVPIAFSLRNLANALQTATLLVFVFPAIAMFLGMNIAGREQSTGTIRFLQALPITGRRPAAAKLVWAGLSVIAPIAAVVGTACLWVQLLPESVRESAVRVDQYTYEGTGELGDWAVSRTLVPMAAGVSLLVWMAAGGVNRSDEVRAGAIGFLIISAYWALLVFLALVGGLREYDPPYQILAAFAAGGISVVADRQSWHFWNGMSFREGGLFFAAFASHLGLATWYVRRFGRVVQGQSQLVVPTATERDVTWLAPPRRSALAAIVWKQFRESAPLALMAAAGILATVVAITWIDKREVGASGYDVLHLATAVWIMVGFMVATVAGIGVFMDDLRPGLHTFWRSRPISVNGWFAVKFFGALLTTVVTLALPLAMVVYYVLLSGNEVELRSWFYDDEGAGGLAAGLVLQCSFYATAVLMIVLLRQPIYAAVMTIAGVGLAAIMAEWLIGAPTTDDARELTAGLAYVVTLFTATVSLAWIALRKDWGWKR